MNKRYVELITWIRTKRKAHLVLEYVEVYTLVGDAADKDCLQRRLMEITQEFGGIDVLIYNVAVREAAPPTKLCTEELTQHYQTEVANALLCVQQILPNMLRQKM